MLRRRCVRLMQLKRMWMSAAMFLTSFEAMDVRVHMHSEVIAMPVGFAQQPCM